MTGEPVEKAHYERSDISVVPAAGVIGEAMVMLTLARFVLEKTGGDSMAEVLDNLHRAAGAHGRPDRGARGRRRLGRARGRVRGGRRVRPPCGRADAGEAGSGGDD